MRERLPMYSILLAATMLFASSCGTASVDVVTPSADVPVVPLTSTVAAPVLSTDVPVVTSSAPTTAASQNASSPTHRDSAFLRLETGPVEAGIYQISYFASEFRLTVMDDGWVAFGADEPMNCDEFCGVGLEWVGDGFNDVFFPIVAFNAIPFVIDPNQPADFVEIPTPEDHYSLFSQTDHTQLLKEEDVTLGGAPGRMFDALIVSAPEGSPVVEKDRQLWFVASNIYLPVGEQIRWIFLDVAGQPVDILIEAHPDDFDRFLPIAEKLVSTVQFAASNGG